MRSARQTSLQSGEPLSGFFVANRVRKSNTPPPVPAGKPKTSVIGKDEIHPPAKAVSAVEVSELKDAVTEVRKMLVAVRDAPADEVKDRQNRLLERFYGAPWAAGAKHVSKFLLTHADELAEIPAVDRAQGFFDRYLAKAGTAKAVFWGTYSGYFERCLREMNANRHALSSCLWEHFAALPSREAKMKFRRDHGELLQGPPPAASPDKEFLLNGKPISSNLWR